MKKLLAILLVLVMVFSLIACAKEETKEFEVEADDVEEAAEEVEADAPEEEPEAPEEEEDEPEEETEVPEEEEDEPEEEAEAPEEEEDESEEETETKTYDVGEKDLYLITDLGTLDDKGFNQGSFEGMKDFADENNVPANYIKPADEGDQIYKDAVDQAVADGAKVIVTPGFLFEAAIYEAQDQYPDVSFVAVDFEPRPDYETPVKVADNTVSILYKEQEAGFLAGYAAVKDGYTKLGFMGGIAVPAVVNFGLGYLSGADLAAKEMGVDVEVRYTYTDSFVAKPEINTLASTWYNNGTEIIFSCGGGILASIAKAAEDNDAKVIGVDVDQVAESETIVTSAMKSLRSSVYEAVKSVYAGNFPGGTTLRLGVKEGGVQLPDGPESFDRFKTFTREDYEAIFNKVKDNTDGIADSIYNLDDLVAGEGLTVAEQMAELEFEKVTLEIVE